MRCKGHTIMMVVMMILVPMLVLVPVVGGSDGDGTVHIFTDSLHTDLYQGDAPAQASCMHERSDGGLHLTALPTPGQAAGQRGAGYDGSCAAVAW